MIRATIPLVTSDAPPQCPRCRDKGTVVQETVIKGAGETRVWICTRCRRLLWQVRGEGA